MKPCPFCGNRKCRVVMVPVGPPVLDEVAGMHAVKCGTCGARGPSALSPAEARKGWDKRKR